MKERIKNYIETSENEDERGTVISNMETKKKFDEIQVEKEELKIEMNNMLREENISGAVSFHKDAQKVIQEENSMFYFNKKREKVEITMGEIMSASMWGRNISLDEGVDRSIKKRFIIGETRRRIEDKWDRQLIEFGKTWSVNENSGRDESYEAIENRLEVSDSELEKGELAEKMLKSFFVKLSENNKKNDNWPIEIKMGDVYDDVQNKSDFIIEIKGHRRGVEVDDEGIIGVQLTTGKSEEGILKKEKQLRQIQSEIKSGGELGIDDIILVKMELDQIANDLKEWESGGKIKDIGGPDMLWDDEFKTKILQGILSKLPKNIEIDIEDILDNVKL